MERQFISASTEFNTVKAHKSAPYLRRAFECVENTNGRARIEISAVGFYRLFLNGKELTKGFFAPYISNPDDIVYYDVYDVTGLLRKYNAVCIQLGNGFGNALDGNIWNFERAPFRAAPKVYMKLTVNGAVVLTTDKRFSVCESPVTFDDLRCGERFDARKIRTDVFDSSLPDALFARALCVPPPRGEYKKCTVQPVVAFEPSKPLQIIKSRGGFIYDFGKVDSGLCRLKIHGSDGQKIGLTYGEILQDGVLDLSNISFGDRSIPGYVQHDEYICINGYQEYLPSFTYHGFRYAFVEGITEVQALETLLEFVPIHSDIRQRGTFKCSHDTVNRIQECVLQSDRSNFYYFPTDCPQREKNGWTADISLSSEQLLYNFDCGASLREWLCNVRKAQTEEGALPGIVPTAGWGYEWGNGPAWDGVIVELPYRLFCFTGDRTVAEENAEAISRWFDYLASKVNREGLLAFGLGDWCEAGAPREDAYSTPLEATDSLVCIDLSYKASMLLKAASRAEDAEKISRFGRNLKKAFRRKYIRNGVLVCRTQTALAMALRFGIFEKSELSGARAELIELLKEKKGHFCTGVLGAKELFDALTEADAADMALQAIVHPDFPSYAYPIERGATTLWESFNELVEDEKVFCRKDGGRLLSLNHHFWGSVSAWFYRVLGGLRLVDCRTAEIRPRFVSEIDWAYAKYSDGDRFISVRWERKANGILLQTDVKGFRGRIACLQNGKSLPLKQGRHEYWV